MADSDSFEQADYAQTYTNGDRTVVAQQPGIPRGNMQMNGSPYNGYPPPQYPYGPQYGPRGPSPVMYQQPGIPYMPYRVHVKHKVFMPPPKPIPGVPRGLEYLATAKEIVVNQLIEWVEFATGVETRNRYSLCNDKGQQVYFAYEQSAFLDRLYDGKNREFSMLITDNFMQPVILIRRENAHCDGSRCCGCNACCSCSSLFGFNGCCKEECLVECPPGNKIGCVVQKNSCCMLKFVVEDMSGKDLFHISGPVCTCCCSDHDWPISDAKDNTEIGSITKEWGGLAKELHTDADTFNISFPIDMNVKSKALLIGATFLIDFMKYESSDGGGQLQPM